MPASHTTTTNRVALILGLLAAVLFLGCIILVWQYGWQHIEIMFADEQTSIFDEMRTQAEQVTSVDEIVGSLQYVVHYYPSGTKQRPGTRLDRIVERHRAAVVRAILVHLRQVTGQDLGDDPELWIEAHQQRRLTSRDSAGDR